MPHLRIATRKSKLALWQAEHVAERLRQFHGKLTVELVKITTQGDKILDAPLAKIGGKGLFVKELEIALLEGRADIAVHSMKDVPVELPEGLEIAAILEREDPRDVFVSHRFSSLTELPEGAVVGTSSLRRQCQLKSRFPHLKVKPLRGNVDTRLAKLARGEFDAIILAYAGLKRLGLAEGATEILDPEILLPAIGQGAIGIECRSEDKDTKELIAPLHHEETARCIAAERAMNRRLGGGCQVPIAGYAVLKGDMLFLRGRLGTPDGHLLLEETISGGASEAEALGIELAEGLLARGGEAILIGIDGQDASGG